MLVKINDHEVEVELSRNSNTFSDSTAFSVMIDGYWVFEVSADGRYRLCEGVSPNSSLQTDKKGRIIRQRGNF